MANDGNDIQSSRTEGQPQLSRPAMAAVAKPAPENVGLLLRKAREKAGQQVRDVSDALNIRYVYIEALEAGDYDKLPGKAYATGFLRTYAQYMELDVGEVLRRFKEEEAGPATESQLVFPTPVPEGKVPGSALILVSVLFIGLVAYGARSYFAEEDAAVADLVPPVPERLQNLVDDGDQGGQPDQTAGRTATTVVTSPVFVLPKPGEEDGTTEIEPFETAAAMPAPTDADPPLEPEIGTASSLGDGDRTEAPAATSPEPATSETDQDGPATAADAQPMTADAPVDEAQGAATETGETASPTIPTEPVVEPGLTTTAGSSPPAEQVAVLPDPPKPASRPAVLERAPSPAAAEPAEEILPETAAIPAAPATEGPGESADGLAPQVYGADNRGSRIVLRATQDCWVQVRDNEDSLLLTRLLRAGDSYKVPNRSGLTMLTGNAGGLEVEVDGTSLGTLGPVGKVRRDVSLDADRLIKSNNLAQ